MKMIPFTSVHRASYKAKHWNTEKACVFLCISLCLCVEYCVLCGLWFAVTQAVVFSLTSMGIVFLCYHGIVVAIVIAAAVINVGSPYKVN